MLPPQSSHWQKNCSYLQHLMMKFDRRNKYDFCCYGQVNCTSVLRNKKVSTFDGTIYFAGDGTLVHNIIMLYTVRTAFLWNWSFIVLATNGKQAVYSNYITFLEVYSPIHYTGDRTLWNKHVLKLIKDYN